MWAYHPNFIPNRINIFGCGGTGSRLVPLVAQFIRTCNWVIDPVITLIDFDTVEEKNLLRQNFINPDVGKNKAEVLAQRYSRAFGVDIIPITCSTLGYDRYASDKCGMSEDNFNKTLNFLDRNLSNSITILCVDSPKARQDIFRQLAQFHRSGTSMFLIDTGNENDFGQVKISTMSTAVSDYPGKMKTLDKAPMTVPFDVKLQSVPVDYDYWFNMQATSTPSCADLDQTMAINSLVANTAFGIIQSIYYVKPIPFHRLNVTLTNGITPEYITHKYLISLTEDSYNVNKIRDKYNVQIPHCVNMDLYSNTALRQLNDFNEMIRQAEEAQKKEEARKAKEAEEKARKQAEAEEKAFNEATKEEATDGEPAVEAKKPTKKSTTKAKATEKEQAQAKIDELQKSKIREYVDANKDILLESVVMTPERDNMDVARWVMDSPVLGDTAFATLFSTTVV